MNNGRVNYEIILFYNDPKYQCRPDSIIFSIEFLYDRDPADEEKYNLKKDYKEAILVEILNFINIWQNNLKISHTLCPVLISLYKNKNLFNDFIQFIHIILS